SHFSRLTACLPQQLMCTAVSSQPLIKAPQCCSTHGGAFFGDSLMRSHRDIVRNTPLARWTHTSPGAAIMRTRGVRNLSTGVCQGFVQARTVIIAAPSDSAEQR
ncbi:hypothetical protein JI435_304030, partial [Parastagonospora nodorum SN15]